MFCAQRAKGCHFNQITKRQPVFVRRRRQPNITRELRLMPQALHHGNDRTR